MQQKLKVGILGAGHIAQKMATTLMGMKEAELYAVAARELSRAEQFANEFHAQKAYGNYEALADDPDIDHRPEIFLSKNRKPRSSHT